MIVTRPAGEPEIMLLFASGATVNIQDAVELYFTT